MVPRVARQPWARIALVVAVVVVAMHGLFSTSLAQPNGAEASERSVKAAFLYKFTEYVDWPAMPAPPAEPFTIGVLGSGAFADELLRMTTNRTIDDRSIRVRRLSGNDAIDDLQVLFVAGDQRGRLRGVLEPAKGRPILTVTESAGALDDGSVINFTVMGDRVRFEISLDAAQENGLRMNSRLLAIAQSIRQTPQPP